MQHEANTELKEIQKTVVKRKPMSIRTHFIFDVDRTVYYRLHCNKYFNKDNKMNWHLENV